MEILELLDENVRTLLSKYKKMEAEYLVMQQENQRLKAEIKEAHAETVTLQRQYRQLQTAFSLAGNEGQKQKAYQEISYLISLVETAKKALR